MNKKEKIKKLLSWPVLFIVSFMVISNLSLCSYARDSNYYDVPDRPPSVFSICCCSKETDDGIQVIYNCKYIEDVTCPENLKQYKNAVHDCPSNLMFTKYTP